MQISWRRPGIVDGAGKLTRLPHGLCVHITSRVWTREESDDAGVARQAVPRLGAGEGGSDSIGFG